MNIRLAVVACIALAAGAASAQERTLLTKPEMEALASGKKWSFVRVSDKAGLVWDLQKDGSAFGRNTSNSAGKGDAGTWSVDDRNALCIKWRTSRDSCVGAAKEGDRIVLTRPRDAASVYGDPFKAE